MGTGVSRLASSGDLVPALIGIPLQTQEPPGEGEGIPQTGKALCSWHTRQTCKYGLPAVQGLLLAARKRAEFTHG